MKVVRVGLVGSQFVSSIHLEALRCVSATEIVAVCSATEAHARTFAERHGIPYQVQEGKPAQRRGLSYADNFSFGRRGAWTH